MASVKNLLVRLPDFPLDEAKRTLTPPIGLWSIRENVPSTEVLDLNVSPIKPLKAETVGLSMHFPSQDRFLPAVLTLMSSDQNVVYGGPHGALNHSPSHYGEGESYFAGKPMPFESLRMPSFSESELESYWKSGSPFGITDTHRWLPIETSRGCVCNCGFCSMPKFWGGWKARSIELINDYLSWCDRRRAIQELIILDDNISLNKERFLGLLEVFSRYDMNWTAPNGIYARSLLDTGVLEALAKSTCRAISLPFECSSDHSAMLMGLGKKHLTHGEASYLVAKLREAYITTTGFFVIGYPGETENDVKQTLAFANSLPLDNRYIYFATPYAGTRLAEEVGVTSTTYKQPSFDTPTLSRERLFHLWKEDRELALKAKGNIQ